MLQTICTFRLQRDEEDVKQHLFEVVFDTSSLPVLSLSFNSVVGLHQLLRKLSDYVTLLDSPVFAHGFEC